MRREKICLETKDVRPEEEAPEEGRKPEGLGKKERTRKQSPAGSHGRERLWRIRLCGAHLQEALILGGCAPEGCRERENRARGGGESGAQAAYTGVFGRRLILRRRA